MRFVLSYSQVLYASPEVHVNWTHDLSILNNFTTTGVISTRTQQVETMASTDDLDALDDLFNHDTMDDVFDRPLDFTKPSNVTEEVPTRSRGTASLGLEEAIEVTRKPRAPKPKLDVDLSVHQS